MEVAINEPADETGFSDSSISYENELEWIIEFILWDSVIVIVHLMICYFKMIDVKYVFVRLL